MDGNQVTNLLREVNYPRMGDGSRYFELLNIQYILLHKDLLDIIEMHESETTGELTEFERKKTLVNLHFEHERRKLNTI